MSVREIPEQNLRKPDYPVWLWDSLNKIVREETGRRRWTFSDIDGQATTGGVIRPVVGYGHLRVRDAHLFLEGTSNRRKPPGGQIEGLQSLALRPGVTVVFFIGEYPDPPPWVHHLVRSWARGTLPSEGYITHERWQSRGWHESL